MLKSTAVIVDGHATKATGVFSYIAIASGAFAIAAVLVVMLVRRKRPSRNCPAPDLERNAVG